MTWGIEEPTKKKKGGWGRRSEILYTSSLPYPCVPNLRIQPTITRRYLGEKRWYVVADKYFVVKAYDSCVCIEHVQTIFSCLYYLNNTV